jgi:hypothetical protein
MEPYAMSKSRASKVGKGQSAPDFDALDAYVAEVQLALNLGQWSVTTIREASDVTAWADIAPHAQAETAELRVSHDFWSQKPERQREVLVHELLHLVICRQDQIVEALEQAVGKIAWSVFESQYEDSSERSVDHIARIIAPTLGLPSFK